MLTVYGIPNCNQIKLTREWLEQHQIEYCFHDYKKQGITSTLLNTWLKQVGADKLVNRKGTTWRKLTDAERSQCQTAPGTLSVLEANPSLIKRPVIENAQHKIIYIGFDAAEFTHLLPKYK